MASSSTSSMTLHDLESGETEDNSEDVTPSSSRHALREKSGQWNDSDSQATAPPSKKQSASMPAKPTRPQCRPCRSISVSMPIDIVETAETPRCTCVAEPEVLGEKLAITDEERRNVPQFCDIQKVISGKGEQLIYVGWNGPDDPENPKNWSQARKWSISVVGFMFCSLVSMSVSGYSIAAADITEALGTSRLLALSGISLFTLTFGVSPLILAPLSEVWGRREIYIISAVVYSVFQIPQAVCQNIQTMLVARFLAGIGGSTAIALVGGTLSDLFNNEDRSRPMAIFALAAFAPTGLGPVVFGYVTEFKGFRLVMWINFALAGAFTVLLGFVAKETRESVLLSRKAKALRERTGDKRFRAQADEERASLTTIIKVSLTRPFRLFLTEPVIQAFTASISFAWAVLYMLLISVPIVYRDVYHFSVGQVGLVYASQIIGAFAATALTIYTDRLYRRDVGRLGPEARMHAGMAGGILMPLGCWIFAWSTWPSVHWIVSAIALGILFAGILLLYLTCFNYLSDAYTLYAASALSAMNVWRNLVGAAFPLFSDQLYGTLGIHGAGSLVAGLATLLAVIPFIAYRYGGVLRRRSKFAKDMAALQAGCR